MLTPLYHENGLHAAATGDYRPLVRVLLAAITCEKGDIEANLARHVELLHEARRAGCIIAVFPEFSLTGSVDAVAHPERAVPLDHPAVQELVAASLGTRVSVVFGLGERRGAALHITQVYAHDGEIVAVQRKRRLQEEEGFTAGCEAARFSYGAARFSMVICAEANAGEHWDESARDSDVILYCSAPGLYGRKTDEASWRDGFDWWESDGLGRARHHAKRLGRWVAMATQAGSTVDEDFPGIAALISPEGDVVDRLPDWAPGTLVVDIPVTVDVEPVRRAIRILVVDTEGRTLLVEFGDDISGRRWWVPPGGGIEAGEDDVACAKRELLEELARDDLEVGPSIGVRGGTFSIGDRWLTQYERWYVCRCEPFEVDPEVVAAGAAEGIRSMRWWTAAELRASGVNTGPRELADLVEAVVAGRPLSPDADLGL